MSARGTQAPRNNPPHQHPNPLRSCPYEPEIDTESCWYGYATEGRSFEQVQAGAEEYVRSRTVQTDPANRVLPGSRSDKILELKGRDAGEARLNAGPWSHEKPVKVTYAGATQKVTKVEPWNGEIVPPKM